MGIPIIGDIIDAVGDGVKSWNDGRVRIKEAKIQAKVAQYESEAKRVYQLAEHEASWDMEAMKQAKTSWKDEFIMLIWFSPFIMLFIPALQDYAMDGFERLSDVPYGYWLVVFGIVAHAFGLRWLFQSRVKKAINSVKTGR